jgi:hypothetical protein
MCTHKYSSIQSPSKYVFCTHTYIHSCILMRCNSCIQGLCVYVCMYMRVYTSLHTGMKKQLHPGTMCMYVCMHECTYVRMCVSAPQKNKKCMHTCMHTDVYMPLHPGTSCKYICMHVCMYVRMYVYVRVHAPRKNYMYMHYTLLSSSNSHVFVRCVYACMLVCVYACMHACTYLQPTLDLYLSFERMPHQP